MADPLLVALVSDPAHQDAVSLLCNELAAHGHSVSNITAHAAAERPKNTDGRLLGANAQLFGQFSLLINLADLFVVILPADNDAACLAGMAHIAGIPVAIIDTGMQQECCFTLRGCADFWCGDPLQLMELIAVWPDVNAGA